jgi:NAD-dependent deacetylase
MQNLITQIKEAIDNSHNIAVFTGAGISVPSGIPDFRSADGLYNQESGINTKPEEIISNYFFNRHTEEFYKFYKEKMIYPNATFNSAHKFFADLEKYNKNVTIITQNIDGLHREAGSKDVLEIHGSVLRNNCTKCYKFYSLKDIMSAPGVPKCSCGGIIKPDVVLYGENLDYNTLVKSINKISHADLLIVVGTSLLVQPANSLIQYFQGDKIIIINKEKTPFDSVANIVINDDIIKVVNELKSYYL